LHSTVLPDPFELEPNTAVYVPRRATVQALAQLQSAIEHDEPLALLRGPAGIGKTLVLRLLRRRVEGRMYCVELEAAGQSADALCARALRALGREPGSAPAEELARAAGERGRAGVLLLIDRGESLSQAALTPLVDLAARCPSLQMVLAAELPPGDHSWMHTPDPRIALVDLIEPMSARETVEYLQARLDLMVAPPEVRRRLDWRSWLGLIRESRGNPLLLHHVARRRIAGPGSGPLPLRLAAKAAPESGPTRWYWIALAGSALALAGALLFLLLDLRAPGPAPAAPAVVNPPAEVLPPPVEPAIPETAEREPEPAPPAAAPAPEVDQPAAAPAPVEPLPPVQAPPPAEPAARPPPVARVVPPPAAPEVEAIPVFVNAVPAARIEIDGRDVGSTPIVGLPVPSGERRFVASFADGRRLERNVDVEGNEVYVLFP
jgi:type II secretory pathway predicted ATPase ExeA